MLQINLLLFVLDSITNEEEKKQVIKTIEQTSKEIISISLKQMNCFAGNMLQLENTNKEKLLVMSAQAFQSLSENKLMLKKYNRIIYSDLKTIETNGGGSARCMIAEVF